MSESLTLSLSLSHSVTLSLSHCVTVSLCHSVTLSLSRSLTPSQDCAYDCASEFCFGVRVWGLGSGVQGSVFTLLQNHRTCTQTASRSAAIARTTVLPKSVLGLGEGLGSIV